MFCCAVTVRSRRRGFTLVELLLVTLVIAVLATIVISAYIGSMDLGRAARTRAQIAKIDALLAPRWESYRTRRVRLPAGTGGTNRLNIANERLKKLRELMRREMPERISDVVVTVASPDLPILNRQYRAMAKPEWISFGENARKYENAECLFLILAHIQDGETNGLDFFRDTEIGDKDGDGMNEILDGWGNPIKFLRWAPGFESDKQGPKNLAWLKGNPDPFDPLNSDVKLGNNSVTYFLYPLIWSNGSDGEDKVVTDDNNAHINYDTTTPPNNPFQWVSLEGATVTIAPTAPGSPLLEQGTGRPDPGFLDNIHNHIVRARVR